MKFHIFCLLLCAVGCFRDDTEKEDFVAQTKTSSYLVRIEDVHRIRREADVLIKNVEIMSDKISASNKICDFIDKVVSLDVSNYDYDQQRTILLDVYNVFIFDGGVVYKAAWLRKSAVLVYELQMKILHWQRKQIERLRPQKDVIFNEMDVEMQNKYSQWRDCYVTIVASFNQSISNIEEMLREFREKISLEESERIKEELNEINYGGCDVFNLDGVLRREVAPMELK